MRILCLTPALALLALSNLALGQWSKSAASNLQLSDGAGAEVQAKLAVSTGGTLYASWYDSDPGGSPTFGYDVVLQRLTAAGKELWPAGGITIADRGYSSTQDYGLDAGTNGDAYLAFRDDRFGGTQITATRVDAAGNQVWGATGVQLTSTTAFLAAPKIAAMPGGGATVAWTQDTTVRLRRLDAAGVTIGAEIVLSGLAAFSLADLQHSVGDSVIVSWISQAGGFFGPRHLYTQKYLSSTGTALWMTGGVPVSTAASLQLGNFPPLVADDAGGAYFAWYTNGPLQCYAQHVLSNGTQAYPLNGALVSTDVTRIRVSPSLALDPLTGDPYVFWTEQNVFQSQSGLRVQRFDSAGNRQFGAEGLELVALGADSVRSVAATAFPGGARALWIGGPGFAQDQVHGALVTDVGGVLLPYPVLAATPSAKDDLVAVTGPLGDVIGAWSGDESGDEGVHAQNVSGGGVLGPLKGSLSRNAGTNLDTYTATVGPLGGTVAMSVDLSTSGHPAALVLGYAQPAVLAFGSQVVLVNIAGGELLALAPQLGPLAQFNAAVPASPSLCGTTAYTQAVHFGGGLPLAITNAIDIYLGL